MSESIRRALEARLNSITPPLLTAWENESFTPTVGVPFQRVRMLYGTPANRTLGCNRWTELGVMQVDLCYPVGGGNSTAQARAELLRSTFRRGLSLTHSGQSVRIPRTPSKTVLPIDGDRYVVAVSIPYEADIFG